MITEIGIVAGDIWHYLDQHKTSTLKQLEKAVDRDKNVIMMFGALLGVLYFSTR